MMEMTCHLNLWKSTKWIKNKRDDKPFSSCEMMILFFDKFNSSDFLSLKKPSASMFFSLSIPPQLSFYLSVSRPSLHFVQLTQLPFWKYLMHWNSENRKKMINKKNDLRYTLLKKMFSVL